VTRAAAALVMSGGQRQALEVLTRSQTAPHRQVERAKALLLAGDGVTSTRIASRVRVRPRRCARRGCLLPRTAWPSWGRSVPGGVVSRIPQSNIEQIVELTRNTKPAGQTHWSGRTMAKKVGVSASTVQRVWAARG
jgi:hypothetical protein